jgi:hypothetical protein
MDRVSKLELFEYVKNNTPLSKEVFIREVWRQKSPSDYQKPKWILLDTTHMTQDWPDLIGVEWMTPDQVANLATFKKMYKGRDCWYWRTEPGFLERTDVPDYADKEARHDPSSEKIDALHASESRRLRTRGKRASNREELSKLMPRHSVRLFGSPRTFYVHHYMAWLRLGPMEGVTRRDGVVPDCVVRMCRNIQCVCPWHVIYLNRTEVDQFFLGVTSKWNWNRMAKEGWLHKLEEAYGHSKEEMQQWSLGKAPRVRMKGFDYDDTGTG